MAGGIITSGVISIFSKVFEGLFGLRKQQSDAISKALEGIEGITEADAAYFNASAKSIETLYTSGGWLERGWRPTLMWVIMALIIARWFGFVPPQLTESEVEHIYTYLYIGLSGYIPLRSLDKWMMGFQIGSILKEFIRKKL